MPSQPISLCFSCLTNSYGVSGAWPALHSDWQCRQLHNQLITCRQLHSLSAIAELLVLITVYTVLPEEWRLFSKFCTFCWVFSFSSMFAFSLCINLLREFLQIYNFNTFSPKVFLIMAKMSLPERWAPYHSCVFSVCYCLVVSTSAIDCLKRFISEMTHYVLSGTLNHTHSLTLHFLSHTVYSTVCVCTRR